MRSPILVSIALGNEAFVGADESELDDTLPTEGFRAGKGTAEAVTSFAFMLDALFGCERTALDESEAGEEINPFATRELRRLESGAAFSALCVDGGGGRPGGNGGREVSGVCVCKVVFSPAVF
jgi:hypothetical protein